MAIFGRRQPHQPLILRPTVLGAAAAPPVGRNLAPHGGRNSQVASTAARQPRPKPIILGPKIIAAAAIPPIGWITNITRASIRAALFARRPLFKPLIRHLTPPAAASTPPVASPPVVRGQLAALAAALAARRPMFKPVLETVIKFSLPAVPPVAKPPIVRSQALAAAIGARRPLFRIIIKGRDVYLTPVPPAAAPAVVRGQLASLAAALAARHPFLFRPFLGKPPISLGPPGPPIPGLLGGGVAPLLNRDPVQDPRLRRAMEILSSMYNSLVGRGYIRQNPIGVWSIQTGAFQVDRLPGINDDSTVGVLPGSLWINTVTGLAYINIVNTPASAVWRLIS